MKVLRGDPDGDAAEGALHPEGARGGGRPAPTCCRRASPDSVLLEVFTPEGCGTLVVPDLAGLSDAERTLRSGT